MPTDGCILVSERLKECLNASALNNVMNLEVEGDAFVEPDSVAILADAYANNYQDGKYKGNQITQLDAEPKDRKCKRVNGTTKIRCKQTSWAGGMSGYNGSCDISCLENVSSFGTKGSRVGRAGHWCAVDRVARHV